jgi:hypothetical protein
VLKDLRVPKVLKVLMPELRVQQVFKEPKVPKDSKELQV